MSLFVPRGGGVEEARDIDEEENVVENRAVAEPTKNPNVSYDEIGTDPTKRTVVILGPDGAPSPFVKS